MKIVQILIKSTVCK